MNKTKIPYQNHEVVIRNMETKLGKQATTMNGRQSG